MSGHIDHIVSEADRGLYHAMNKGVRVASGDFVYFLNSDDCFCDSTVLADVTEAIHLHPDADLVYGDVLIRKDGQMVRKPQVPVLNRETFCRRGLCHQALFARRSALLDNGGFSEDYRIVSDGDWMARTIAAGARSHHMDRDIAVISPDGLSWSTNWLDEKRRCQRANYTAWELFRWRKLPGLLGLRKD
jgi:GT2 family glycosyltransferase